MTRKIGTALSLLALLSCSSPAVLGPTRSGNVRLEEFGPLLDAIYTQVGKRELLFCLEGEPVAADDWKVTRVVLPKQEGDSVSVTSEGCDGFPGDIHNHPENLGGEFTGSPPDPSLIDFRSFYQSLGQRFFLIWYGPGRIKAYFKI